LFSSTAQLTAATASTLFSSDATASNLFSSTAQLTAATASSLFSSTAQLTAATASSLFSSDATASNLFSSTAQLTAATASSLFSSDATITNANVTSATVGALQSDYIKSQSITAGSVVVSSGTLSVGYQSPENPLFVGRPDNTSGVLFSSAVDGAGTLFAVDRWGVGGQFIIKASGDIGVGTSTPGYKLDVIGTSRSTAAIVNDVDVTPSSGDIVKERTFYASNNVASFSEITGFAFNNAVVRSFEATMSVGVKSDAYATQLFAVYKFYAVQKNGSWTLNTSYVGDVISQLQFSINSSGQVQYKSADIPNWNVTVMKFKANTTSC
jgi:hypothetical protein